MVHKYFTVFLFLFFISAAHAQQQKLNYIAVCFYYNWYGNVALNEKPYHWSHEVIKQNDKDTATGAYPAGGNIGANYYPQLGEYSNADSAIAEQHMQQIASAGIGIIVVTWLGENDFTFKSVPVILNAANRYGIKVCFHIEPVVRKTALTTRNAIEFLITTFGNHPAFYRNAQTKRPMFFVYDSYMITAKDWADVFTTHGNNTIRNTPFDADMIGLWVTNNEQQFFLESGSDGFYTYFASEGFTYGSTTANWSALQTWAEQNKKIFIPCVGPGYIDERVRPWNAQNTKQRDGGKYYDNMFKAALNCKAKWIGITSFNEWHEGTQIEPAVPFSYNGFVYKDYLPQQPDYYLQRTRYWLEKFK